MNTAPPPSNAPAPKKDHRVPAGTGTFGMALFLLSLSMLFAASMLAYTIVRVMGSRPRVGPDQLEIPPTAPPLHSIDLPITLWLSTAIILLSSFTIHLALVHVRHERQAQFRRSLTMTLVLAVLFLLVQAPSLGQLLVAHFSPQATDTMRGAIFFLIVIHALHVVGGIIPLFIISQRAHADRYDHEAHGPVKYITMYWHFLDGVWLVMFALLGLLG